MFRCFVILTLCLSATPALAANNTIATALQMQVGQRRQQVLAAAGVGYYGVRLYAGRSYAAFCVPESLEDQGAASNFCLIDIRTSGDVMQSTYQFSEPEPFPKAGSVSTYTPTGSAAWYVRVLNQTNFTVDVAFFVIETTLASPWYFVNAAAGYDGYVEIRNQSVGVVNVVLTAHNADGSVAGSASVAVPANGGTLRPMSSLGANLTSGSATISHNGMPGSIVANITTLSGTTGLSFDAPFVARMGYPSP